MGRHIERSSHQDEEIGKGALDISIGVVRNVLDSIDRGMTTKQIRESLDRIEKGEAIVRQDTGFFVLGGSPNVGNQRIKGNK